MTKKNNQTGTLFNIRQEKKYCFRDKIMKINNFVMTDQWKFDKM